MTEADFGRACQRARLACQGRFAGIGSHSLTCLWAQTWAKGRLLKERDALRKRKQALEGVLEAAPGPELGARAV